MDGPLTTYKIINNDTTRKYQLKTMILGKISNKTSTRELIIQSAMILKLRKINFTLKDL